MSAVVRVVEIQIQSIESIFFYFLQLVTFMNIEK